MSETKLLEMNDITKAFSSNIVLNGVKLSINEGEVVAILGENGAGKSTLIKILGGIYKADSGEIRIHGEVKNISSAAVAGANGIRIIHQEIVLVPDRTIAANVFLGREPRNKFGLVDIPEMERQTQKLIDDLNLNLRADQLVRSLTMGMQQLVEIIKAISAEAKIVVMDEPTSSLSQGEVEILFGIIQLLQKKNIGIIYISHRLEELFAITDRIVVLRDGKMVGDIKTKEAEKDNLINLMVGRELDSFYTKNRHHIGEIALSVKNLSHEKYFSNASFTARYGEIVGFAGLVGSGRTELMKTVFGAYAKKNGEIQLDGKSLEIKNPKDAIRNGIAYVSEDRRGEGLILKNDVKFNMGLVCLKDFVKGIRVETPFRYSLDEEITTYEFTLYGNPEYVLSGNQTDGSESIKVYLNIHYKTQPNGKNSEYLLTRVTGNWEMLDSRVSVTNASVSYGCSDTGHSQNGEKAVGNNFSVDTGFNGYILPEMGGICGASLTTNLKMGSTRTWTFVMKNNVVG